MTSMTATTSPWSLTQGQAIMFLCDGGDRQPLPTASWPLPRAETIAENVTRDIHLCSNESSAIPSSSSSHCPLSSCTKRFNLNAVAATDTPSRLKIAFPAFFLTEKLDVWETGDTTTRCGLAGLVSSVIKRRRDPLQMGSSCCCSACSMSSMVVPATECGCLHLQFERMKNVA